MNGNDVTSDQVIAKLVGMGFEFSDITDAIKAVGPSLDNAIEFILNDARTNNAGASTASLCLSDSKVPGKRATSSLQSSCRMRQQNITEHLNLAPTPKRSKVRVLCNESTNQTNSLTVRAEGLEVSLTMDTSLNHCPQSFMGPSYCKDEEIMGFDWENKVKNLLQKHFGFSSLKGFQKEVLAAWLANQDCLVLAATGSGKSLCFQVPALLSGKVVVVISPLISLMHDQCLKLAKHGISACFLGSGQIDKSVEQKAMTGSYSIIYVCPETILRLIKPLQSLAESRGIALFAIDEVHCVSKWGHDFRPDYRRLSVLREKFSADNLKFLKSDIPLMALTATATIRVREDILKSLCMSMGSKVIITSFFRPNLRFSVKHSRTSSLSSYEKDFDELIGLYTKRKKSCQKLIPQDTINSSRDSCTTSNGRTFGQDEMCQNIVNDTDDSDSSDDDETSEKDAVGLWVDNGLTSRHEKELSVQFLEDDFDKVQEADDLDVSCGAFCGQSTLNFKNCGTPDSRKLLTKAEKKPAIHYGTLPEGPTIIYVPTRKETLSLAKFLSRFGVKAAAYNAKLPKSHLRQVHKEFHEDVLQVVVATIAFGMGIDKSNVRRIIHYGWPQSLEAYYQEAGRAGRDGKLADCVLYANLSRVPTLLPSQRSEEQTKQAYKMLSDCYRYGMKTSICRAKMLVEYFGEEFTQERCLFTFIFTLLLLLFLFIFCSLLETYISDVFVSQNQTFAASDLIWWRGLARMLQDRGFIREGDDMSRVQLRFPEATDSGLRFLKSTESEQAFDAYLEADMLLSMNSRKSYSSFSEWGKGWADPEIRRQRLERRALRKPRKRKSRKNQQNLSTVRGRLSAKLSKLSK
ncbi:hypothetical protein RD792_001822 [Penstemon davidsonii]|uniref:ATP-dependent DNA helicase n=1 Tax=Penstemon davidsonii TaxID=160366 RepID=A0ABR0DPH3_9LAMI|nr:hypothetical protein RD792_001822 [Penstemon davidsonii]